LGAINLTGHILVLQTIYNLLAAIFMVFISNKNHSALTKQNNSLSSKSNFSSDNFNNNNEEDNNNSSGPDPKPKPGKNDKNK